MLTRGEADRNNQERLQQGVSIPCERLRAIAYSMDALILGLFIWFGPLKIRFGGSEAEETYSGTIHSFALFGASITGLPDIQHLSGKL